MNFREDGGMRVLIADDEESIRFVLREALEIDGHIVNEGSQVPQGYDYFVFQDLEQSFVIENNSLDRHYDFSYQDDHQFGPFEDHWHF